MPMKQAHDIFSYSDFRAFLKTHYEEMKQHYTYWSLGVWARKLNVSSTSTISMILNGKRLPSDELIEKFIDYFEFSTEQKKEYFRDLIQLKKYQENPRLSVLLMEKLGQKHPSGEFHLLDAESFSLISHWYHYAIREMTRLKHFKEDTEWIQKKLRFPVTHREIQNALKRLLDLGLLKRNELSNITYSEGKINTENDIAQEGLKRFHEQMLNHAQSSIRNVDVTQREIRGSTFTIQSKDLPKAKEWIRNFMNEFADYFNANEGDDIYQLNFQLFPLTKNQKEGGH